MNVMNNMKLLTAQQARITHQHKSTKRKLFKTNAAVWSNNM